MPDINIIIIMALFFLVNIIIGCLLSKSKDTEDFLIANRKLGLFESIMTINGTFIGAITLLVYTAYVFEFGISAIWIFIGYCIGFFIFSIFGVYLKKYSEGKNFYTITDYFKDRFGKKVALFVISIITIFYFGTLSAQFIGGGFVLSKLTGIGFEYSAIIMCLVIVTYLIVGGFKSVVKTDIFQFIFLVVAIVVLAFSIKGGITIPVEHFNIFNAGIGNIFAFLLLGVFGPFATQDFWQRIYAMKDVKTVKRSFVISGFIVLFISIFLTYIGLVTRSLFPTIAKESAGLTGFTELVPPFLVGFVAIAFFAAIISTIDTFLFLIAVNVTHDFIDIRKTDPKKTIFYTRIAILVVGASALFLALIYNDIVNVTIIFKSIGIVIAPIVLIIWFTKGDDFSIIVTIIITISLVFGITIINLKANVIDPKLVIYSIFTSFIVYSITSIARKALKRSIAS